MNQGQKVRTLIDDLISVGRYQIQWDGTDDNGNAIGSGVYFYKLKTSDFIESKKMILLK